MEVEIQTIPAVRGFGFSLDGASYRTGSDGTVKALTRDLCRVSYRMQPEASTALGDDMVAQFHRWHGTGTVIRALFNIDYRVSLTFIESTGQPVEPRRIGKVTLKNNIGAVRQVHPDPNVWLLGIRVNELTPKPVYWTVERVDVSGNNVVNRSQVKFFPAETRHMDVRVLFYTARVRARDAFTGKALGRAVEVLHPDGTVARHALDRHGRVILANMARGDYHMRVEGPGLRIFRPVSMSRDQDVDLKVFSYADLAALAVGGLILAVGLVLAGRARLRRRRYRSERNEDRPLLPPPSPSLDARGDLVAGSSR